MSRKTREKIRAALEGVTDRDAQRKRDRLMRLAASVSRQRRGISTRYERSRYVGGR